MGNINRRLGMAGIGYLILSTPYGKHKPTATKPETATKDAFYSLWET